MKTIKPSTLSYLILLFATAALIFNIKLFSRYFFPDENIRSMVLMGLNFLIFIFIVWRSIIVYRKGRLYNIETSKTTLGWKKNLLMAVVIFGITAAMAYGYLAYYNCHHNHK